MFSTVSSSSSSSSSSAYSSLPRDLPAPSSSALQQMIQLTNPIAPEVPRCQDPNLFFSQFSINTRIFTTQDVELIQQMYQTLKFHPNVCLFDILGLKFYVLLKELSAPFSPELQEDLIEGWTAMYLQAYLNLFRESPTNCLPKTNCIGNFTIPAKAYYTFILEFTEKLTNFAKTKLSQQLPLIKSSIRRNRLKGQVDSLLAEWNSLQKFIGKCLILPFPSQILCDHTLIKSPGSKQMEPRSLEDVQQAGQNLYDYFEMIATAHYANAVKKWTSLITSHFKDLLSQLKPLTQLKNSQEIIKCAKKCLAFNSQRIVLLQKKIEEFAQNIMRAQIGTLTYEIFCQEYGTTPTQTKTQERFLESLIQKYHQITLESCWLTDCQKVLEESILSPLDPSFYTTKAYEYRIFDNLKMMAEDQAATLELADLEEVLLLKTPFQQEIQRIRHSFFICFHHIFDQIEGLALSLQTNYGNLLKDSSKLELITLNIEKLLEKTLDQLCDLNPDMCKGEPLLQELLWLCRIFIFLNDINYITLAMPGKTELDIFPSRFLQFLALEEETVEETQSPHRRLSLSGSKPDSEEESLSLESLQLHDLSSSSSLNLSKTLSDSELGSLSNLSPESRLPSFAAASSSEPLPNDLGSFSSSDSPQVFPSNREKKQDKTKAPAQTALQSTPREPSPPRFPQAIDPRSLLAVTKRRHVEKILAKLGLQPIRTKGSHTVWQHSSNARIQTVVPHHSEIAEGTRHAILEQVTGEE